MAGRTALLVESDPETRTFCRAVLQRDGYRVIETQDAATALRLARQERPDLLVRRASLRLADGSTLADALRQDSTTAHVKVLTVTINEGPLGPMRLLSYATEEPRRTPAPVRAEPRQAVEALRRMVSGALLV